MLDFCWSLDYASRVWMCQQDHAFLEQKLAIKPISFQLASFRCIMKLRQRPYKSLIGIKFKFSHEHSMLFYTESSLPDSKCLTGSDGVKEWNRPTTTTWKINIFQVKNYITCHTEAWYKFYDIAISFAIYFDKKSYFFTSQMKPLPTL